MILKGLREEVANNEYMNRTIHNYFENKKIMETCKLFKFLNAMPKGGLHHIHTTAAIPLEAYLEATYDDRVYYSEREQLFKVYPLHKNVKSGFIQCNKLRQFSTSTEDFDKKLALNDKNYQLGGQNTVFLYQK